MTSPDFSVLLLAWDDADPGVAVLGGSALPPTLPLVYELAAQHPVVALFPHLPAEAAATPVPPAAAASAPAQPWPGWLPDPLATPADSPGVRLLPAPAVAPVSARSRSSRLPVGAARATRSRLVGLADLLPPTQAPLTSAHRQPAQFGPAALADGVVAISKPPLVPLGRSQWPTPPGPPASWQAPVAPYAGADSAAAGPGAAFPSSATPIAAGQFAREVAAAASDASAALRHPDSQLLLPPPPRPPGLAEPAGPTSAFDETIAEMGAAEARDLDAAEDDLTLEDDVDGQTAYPTPGGGAENAASAAAHSAAHSAAHAAEAAFAAGATAAPAASPAAPTAAPLVAAGPAYTPRRPRLEGLNFRMIQYARQAMQLVAGHGAFGVIYAPAWPAWLAALEIRNRLGQPLVLYAAALPSDTAGPAERGWLLHIERMALRRAHLVLVPDAAMQQQLRARHGAELGEVRVVPARDEMALQLVLAEVALG